MFLKNILKTNWKFEMGTCILHGTASVDGSQVAEGEILASVVNRRQ